MVKVFNIVENNNENSKHEYPQLPFVVKSFQGNYFIVCKDAITNKYRYIDLNKNAAGEIINDEFSSIEDMFERFPSDKIFNVELIIKGEYK